MNELNFPLYTALLGGGLIIVQSILMLIVGMHRGKTKNGVGVGSDTTLERKVRRHANLTESGPMFVFILAIYEIIFGQTEFAFWIALIFAAARLFHIIGFSSTAGSHLANNAGPGNFFVATRAIGATGTALGSIALGGTLLYSILSM